MFKVQVKNATGLENLSYDDVYGECPESIATLKEAEEWAYYLSHNGTWPEGNPGYEVVEI